MTKRVLPEVTYVDGQDWDALYIDGVLFDEGHSVSWENLLQELGITVNYLTANNDWLVERGSYPDKLRDMQQDHV